MTDIIKLNTSLVKAIQHDDGTYEYAQQQSVETDIFNYRSKELLINLKPSDIPPKGHIERGDFIRNEKKKVREGVTINGVHIIGSLYYHWNFHTMVTDSEPDIFGKSIPIRTRPDICDNDWLIHNEYHLAQIQKNKEVFAVGGSRQIGKDLLNSSILYKDSCETTIGDCNVGDNIYDDSGNLTTIIAKYPQGVKPVYKITLLDGRELFCGLEHNWYVYNIRSKKYVVKTTKELLIDYKRYRDSWKSRINPYEYIYSIDTCKPIKYSKKDLEIDGYLYGIWLGDGSSSKATFHSIDNEIIESISNYCKEIDCILSKCKNSIEYSIRGILTGKGRTNTFLNFLIDNNLINNKHILNDYFYGDYNQRLSLLQGLLDSDGTVTSGTVSFNNSNYQLIKDVAKLVRSLGMSCKIIEKQNVGYKNKSNDFVAGKRNWNLIIYTDNKNVFRLSRKSKLVKRTSYSKTSIVNIEYVYDSETTCITVDNESHLFLTDNYTITHNTENIVSMTARELFSFKNSEVLGLFSISEDKQTFTKKFQNVLTDKSNFLIVPAMDKDLTKKQIRFGFTETDNTPNVYSNLFLYLTQEGVNTEAGAGKTVTFFFFDEIAKYPMKSVYSSVIDAMRGKYGFRCSPFLAFTGGNAEKGTDAKNLYFNPKSNNIRTYQNDGKDTGYFMPAYFRRDFKESMLLSEYLKVDVPRDSELNSLKIEVMNKELAEETIKEERRLAALDPNPVTLLQRTVYNPITTTEIFLTVGGKPFENFADRLRVHRDLLIMSNKGRKIDVSIESGVPTWRDSKKLTIQNFPKQQYEPDDCAIVMYEPPLTGFNHYWLHAGGLDPYNTSQTVTSSSLASFYLIRRQYSDLKDTYKDTMVLSYYARPDKMTALLENIRIILMLYNGTMLHEVSNDLVLNHFDKNNEADKFLCKTWNLAHEINPDTKSKSSYGLPPTPKNQSYIIDCIKEYLSETIGFDKDGNEILGYTRILDPMLCEELIEFSEDGNFDRIWGFGHAVVYCKYLDKYNVVEERREVKISSKPVQSKSPFTMGGGSFIKRRQ